MVIGVLCESFVWVRRNTEEHDAIITANVLTIPIQGLYLMIPLQRYNAIGPKRKIIMGIYIQRFPVGIMA